MENFTALPCITIIVYLFAELFKQVTKNEKNQFIPVFCGVLGGILGGAGFFLAPSFINAENIFCAVAIGIVSGFSATGVNQIYKQFTVKNSNKDEK